MTYDGFLTIPGQSGVLLHLQGIQKAFAGTQALSGAHLKIREGEVHAVLGENGAGKSTLMNIIAGVTAPDGGTMEWRGQPFAAAKPRAALEQGISFVHQELALVPQLSAAENIFLGRHPATRGWVAWEDIRRRAADVLRSLGSAMDPETPVETLSLAQRQMVEIARALAFASRLIILDEPTAPLDDRDANALFRTIRDLAARGIAIILITHRLREVFHAADRVTVLRDGRTVLEAAIAEVTQDGLVDAMVGPETRRMAAAAPGAARECAPFEALRLAGEFELTLRRGEVVGLAGLAGSGRTRLLERLFGARRPHLSGMFLHGAPARVRSPRDAVRQGLALLPDDRKAKSLIPGAGVSRNIGLAAERDRWFLDRSGEARRAAELCARLRIKLGGLDQPIESLSGGNQQKAVLARWLCAGARVFLLDEPTRGIDVRSKAEIHELIRSLARDGAAVLMASSDTEELLRLAGRVVVMHRGRIAGELPAAEATEERILRLAT